MGAQAILAQVSAQPGPVSQCAYPRAAMGSNSMPVRIAHGWAIVWLDFYQTPAIVTEGVVGEVKGFFRELTRSKDAFPHNHVNFQNAEINRLGRPKQYADAGDDFPFAGCS